jgi:AraC-like DNA-binding protein
MSHSAIDMRCSRNHLIDDCQAAARFGQTMAMLDRAAAPPVPSGIVIDEIGWRVPPVAAGSGIVATRWRSSEDRVRDVSTRTGDDGYVIGLALRPMDIRLSTAGRVVQDGMTAPGMIDVSEPSAPAHCLFRGPYDAVHLHVPTDLLNEYAGQQATGTPAILRSRPVLERDPTALQLGLALLRADEFGASFGRIYADGITLAIVSRLLALQTRGQSEPERRKTAGLSKWRLRRVIDYVEANLGEPIALADIAAASGLSRMHFAAQFKASTGCPPHEYVVRRRINKAQEIMMATPDPLVEVALQVGFQSQAHFTTVFKRIVGQPPYAWRQRLKPSA